MTQKEKAYKVMRGLLRAAAVGYGSTTENAW